MKKRLLSMILVVLMIISLFASFTMSVSAASMTWQYTPTVYIGGGGEYNIVWKNNLAGIGYVTYKYNGKTYTVYDEEDGVVRSDDNTHTVRIPQEHLDAAGFYTVHTAEVLSRNGYEIKTGAEVTFSSTFTGYHKQADIKWAFISDTHLWKAKMSCRDSAVKAVNEYMGGVDLIVLNGDIANNMPTEDDFNCILDIANSTSKGQIPVLYVKGNHECRGYYAQKLYKYLVYDTNEFYGSFTYGPISSIIIDIGEDKEDGHEEYGGLNDMDHYFDEQYKWLENMGGYDSDSQYHLAISHSPTLIDRYKREEFNREMTNHGTDLLVCGHSHNMKYVPVGNGNKLDFPVFHDGGHDNNEVMRTTLVTFSGGKYNIQGFNASGNVTVSQVVQAVNGVSSSAPTVEKEETPVKQETVQAPVADDVQEVEVAPIKAIPTAAGISVSELKGATDKTAMATKPVVFDCGDYYCVVWQTTPGIECAGYIDVKSSTKTAQYVDSFAGKLRTETTHSVKIPKSVFSGANYTVKSRVVVNYNMYGYVAADPTKYGPWANGVSVKFGTKYNEEAKTYNILTVANTAGGAVEGKTIKATYKQAPDLVVSLGNNTKPLNTEADFKQYLDMMYEITLGQTPVLFLRGETETTGAFAANLGNYIRTTTEQAVIGKYYSNSTLGDGEVAIVGLDTGAESPDGDAKYKGLATFDPIRKEQIEWMNNTIPSYFVSTYNLVFAHADNLANCNGVNLTEGFEKLETNIIVTGQSGKSTFKENTGSCVTVTCGSAAGDGTQAMLLTLKQEKITVKTLGSSAAELGVVDIAESKFSAGGAPEDPGPSTDPENKPTTNPENKPTTDPEKDETKDPADDNKEDTTDPDDNKEDNNNINDSDPDDEEYDDNNSYNDDYEEGDDSYYDDYEDDGYNSNGSTGNGEGYYVGGGTETQIVPGEYDGVDGGIYVRDVPEGWYNDYISLGYDLESVSAVTVDGSMTQSEFIYIYARLLGVNLDLFEGSDPIEKAAAWAETTGIYTGYLGGETPVTGDIISALLDGVFAVEAE